MRKLTNKEAIDKLLKNNSNIIFIDQYYSSREKSHFKCLICNNEWTADAKGVINGSNGCPECGKKKARETIKYNISTDDFKIKVKKIFEDKLSIIGEYVNFHTNIEIKCNICNHNWYSKPTYLMKKYGCDKCGHVETGKKQRKSHDVFIDEIYMGIK